jgi:hypothetical protein
MFITSTHPKRYRAIFTPANVMEPKKTLVNFHLLLLSWKRHRDFKSRQTKEITKDLKGFYRMELL